MRGYLIPAVLALLASGTVNAVQASPYQNPHLTFLPGKGLGNPTIIVGSANGVGNAVRVANQGGIGNPTIIVNSGNGVANTIGVHNRGGVGNPTVIVGSANGANNRIGVLNRGGVGNPTIIRNSANGVNNAISVFNKAWNPAPFAPHGMRHFEQAFPGQGPFSR